MKHVKLLNLSIHFYVLLKQHIYLVTMISTLNKVTELSVTVSKENICLKLVKKHAFIFIILKLHLSTRLGVVSIIRAG